MSKILPSSTPHFTEAAIFGRVMAGAGPWSRELAEHVLSLTISDIDRTRIEELLRLNSEGQLSDGEQQELESFNHVADLLSLWHSRARLVLKQDR